MTNKTTPLTFLSLPYDIRFLIYEHLFPSSPQIYLQALPDQSITAILAEGTVATDLFLTCRAIYSEAAGYLYNTYLFNLIGTKEGCLHSHKAFLQTLRKHAHGEVHLDALSNGSHSETMCISMYTGEGKVDMMRRRGRGVAVTLREIEEEIGDRGSGILMTGRRKWWCASIANISIASFVVVLLACLLHLLVLA